PSISRVFKGNRQIFRLLEWHSRSCIVCLRRVLLRRSCGINRAPDTQSADHAPSLFFGGILRSLAVFSPLAAGADTLRRIR
ncbi:MAG: hypothetical protein RSD27_08825, partial [Ruthenibacterium sp.]